MKGMTGRYNSAEPDRTVPNARDATGDHSAVRGSDQVMIIRKDGGYGEQAQGSKRRATEVQVTLPRRRGTDVIRAGICAASPRHQPTRPGKVPKAQHAHAGTASRRTSESPPSMPPT
jgi:hypothetical protein